MTPRERILRTLARKPTDRVPLGFDANEVVLGKLLAHFNVATRLELYAAMGIDGFSVFTESYVPPRYVGPPPPALPDGVTCDFFGIDFQQRHLPLAFAETPHDLDRYAWPDPDDFDYSDIRERCLRVKALGLPTVGGEGGCGIQHAINLRGFERALTDPFLNPDLAHAYMMRMGDFFVAWNERWLAAAHGEFDIFRCGDELGSSSAMHCAPDVWRAFYKPQLRRVFAVAKRHGLRIWFHCCGCCRPVLDDLVEIGVDMWDPVPAYVAGNAHPELKRLYGDKLVFVGGVDQPNVLVQGSPADVRDDVKRCMAELGPDGFILTGSQVLTDDIPLANVLAMYEAALEHGSRNARGDV